MVLEKIKITDLKEYENNAKEHPEEQINQIIASIKEFGFNDPIAIDENNVIIEGHGRLYALQRLGTEEVDCIRLSHLSEEQKRAYILAHNKLTMNTGFDIEKLNLELDSIMNLDMSLFGFIQEEPEGEVVEDNFEIEEPEEPVSQYGNIYQLGKHRLMCGDSTKAEDVAALMNGELADLVVTDPPYNVDYGSKAEACNKYGYQFNDRHIMNDYMPEYQFIEFLDHAFRNMSKSMKEGAAFYIWHASITIYEFETALRLNNLKSRQQLVWNKNSIVLGRQDYQWKHEPCLYGWKEGAAHFFIDDRTNTSVIEDQIPKFKSMKKEDMVKLLEDIYSDKISTTIINEDKPNKSVEHPTMKPLQLLARHVKNSSKQEELILDIFGGSGSTMMTCEQLNRRCFMMELDPKYVDVIIERWEKFTGEKAVKLN